MLANTKWSENSPHDSIADNHPNDVVDTTRADLQYVAAAGLTTRGGLRLSATERLHVLKAGKLSATAVRASFEHRLVALSLYAEHRGGDSTSNEEASATFTPVSFFALSGAVGYRHGGTSALGEDKGLSLRAEAGLRVSRAWVSGGILRRPMTVVPGLIAYDTIYTAAPSAAATGVFGSIRGKFYKDFGLDVWGVRWNAPGWYRPRMQSREELYLDTRWLSRFPSGNFGFVGAIGHEYRQDVLFPTAGASETFASPNVSAFFSHSLTTRLEIRILDAHIFWNSFYGISPTTLEYVPGFLQPRQRFIYGVRWEFWN
jgi:hypothetical protein